MMTHPTPSQGNNQPEQPALPSMGDHLFNMRQGLVVLAPNGALLWANRSAGQLLGLDISEITSPAWQEAIQTLSGQTQFSAGAASTIRLPAQAGQPSQVIRLWQEQAQGNTFIHMEQAESAYAIGWTEALLLSNQPIAIWDRVTDPNGKLLDLRIDLINPPAAAILRRQSADLLGTAMSAIYSPDKLQPILDLAERANQTGRPYSTDPFERDGRTMLVTIFKVDDRRLGGISVDVTEHFQSELEVRRESEKTRHFLESLPSLLWSATAEGEVDMFNSNYERYTGISASEMISKGWHEVIHPDDQATLFATWQAALKAKTPTHAEARMRNSKGVFRWHAFFVQPAFSADGTLERWYGLNVDIQDQKDVELRLEDAIEKFQLITENINEVLWIIDAQDDSLIYASPSYKDIFGYTPQERKTARGSFLNTVHPDDRQLVEQKNNEKIAGKTTETVFRVVWPNGEVRTIKEVSHPILEANGSVRRVVGVARDVTEEVTTRRSLNESEERFRLLVENMDEAFWLAEPNTDMQYYSPAMERIYGRPLGDFKNFEDFAKIIYPPDLPDVREAVLSEAENARTYREFRIILPDGSLKWVWDRTFPILDGDGNRLYTAGVMADIHARKEAELQLAALNADLEKRIAERTQELQMLYDNAPIGYHSLSTSGYFIRVNKTEQEWLGYSEEEFLKMRFPQILAPESLPDFAPAFERMLREGHIENLEFTVIGKDGTRRNIIISARLHVDDEGKNSYTYSSMVDHTTLRKIRTDLAETAEKFHALFENSIDPIFLRDAKTGEMLDANRSARETLGYTLEELKALPINQLMAEETSLAGFPKFVEMLAKGGRIMPNLRHYITKAGQLVAMEVSYSLIHGPDGKPLMMQFTCRDLSERMRAEAETQRQRDFARLLMDTIHIGLAVIDTAGKVEYANASLGDFLGIGLQQIQNRAITDFVPSTPFAEYLAGMRAGLAPKPLNLETEMNRHDGVVRQILLNASPRMEGNVLSGCILSFVDITKEKETEQNLRLSAEHLSNANRELERAVRLKDEFLASMSHELRTPLTGILGLSEVLLAGSFGALNEKQANTLRNIESSGRHLQDLINDILDLSRMEAGKLTLNPELVLADELCRSSVRLVEGMAARKNQAIQLELPDEVVKIYCDLKRVKQTIVNLLSNAIKFTPDGGQLGLRLQAMPGAGQVRITVWDSGIGISRQDQERIFQPFVQLDSALSRQYSGTGLGLALAAKFMQLHQGSIVLESEPGKGSMFSLLMPWHPNEEGRLIDKALAARLGQGGTGMLRSAAILGSLIGKDEKLPMQLRAIGMRVSTAQTLEELERDATRKAGLVALMMADDHLQDGRTWQEAIRADSTMDTVSLIIFHPTAEEAAAAPATPNTRNLDLPSRIEPLRAAVEELFNPALPDAVAPVPAQPAIPTEAEGAPTTAQAATLLVVEDNMINREMLLDFLTANGYNIITAENGEEAVEQTKNHLPALVLMDIQMPGMDGLEATRRIRALPDPKAANVQIIAVTALAMTGDKEKILEAGCNQYVSKPVNLPNLVRLIQATLG